jgi:glycosyltransferase involved in cell wall biosynthesis
VLAWPAYRKQAANPHAALLADALRALDVAIADWTPLRAAVRPADLWHIHHPDTVVYPRGILPSLAGTVLFRGLLAVARLRGTKIVWTIHDLGSNDGLHPRLERWFWRFFVPRVDAFITLSDSVRELARARFPTLKNRPGFTVRHGHYRDAYPGSTSRAAARRALDLPDKATVLLNFGRIRPYKNVPHLLRMFQATPGADLVLVLASQPYDAEIEAEVREAAGDDPRVRLVLRWIAPEEVHRFFAAADLVVLPYRRILNSGAATLALTFGRRVLLPDMGAMRDLQQQFGRNWVRLYPGELGPDDLVAACGWAAEPPTEAPDLAGLDWTTLARQTLAVYQAISGPAGAGVRPAETVVVGRSRRPT